MIKISYSKNEGREKCKRLRTNQFILHKKKIVHQMMNCIGKIKLKGATGTGFFCKIPLNKNNNINCFMTNYHILNKKYFEDNREINILINDDSEVKVIDLNIKRKIYYNKEYDTTIIELKEEDKIKEYLELDDNIFKDNEKIFYEDKSIYIIQYPKGSNGDEEASISFGILNKITKYNIIHKCSTDNGSSGSPILNLKNNKVIGIHKGSPNHLKDFNYRTLLKYPLNDFINRNKTNDIIISEIYINKNNINKDIRIINSFENVKREWKFKNSKDDYLYANEKEIKENIELKINGKIIEFTYYYKFKEEGKHTIEYIFKNNLTKTNYMFYRCNLLININFLNFNTKNVVNMACMFEGCLSLTNLNLSNFNTQNVTNMSNMFLDCNSLINLNLSNFNTKNVINMACMFEECNSLTNLNLSNFNTQNVTNMSDMFRGCNSLTNLNLSNFNTQNVTNMSCMFRDCKSLTNLNLSNFYTQNVTNMIFMFVHCKSLSNLNISNFNTKNVKDMGAMFYGCKSLKKDKIIIKDNKILNEINLFIE